MKSLSGLLVSAGVLYSSLSFGAPHLTRPTEVAISSLGSVAQGALSLADSFAQRRWHAQANDLDRISDDALHLSRATHRSIIRSIQSREPVFRIAQEFAALDNDFQALEVQVARLRGPDYQGLQNAFYRAKVDWDNLTALLRQPGPGPNPPPANYTASCVGKSGGNFLRPKSHVECTIYGRGLAGYEVIFRGGSTAKAIGTLNRRMDSQNIESDKVEVGWNPDFELIVIDSNRVRHVVARGRASR